MTGTVQVKKGRPNYYIVLGYIDSSGKRIRPWITTDIPVKGNNKRLANIRLKEVLHEYESKKIDLSKDILFTDFLKQWLENLYLSKSIAQTTYDAYKMTLNAHLLPHFNPLLLKVRDIEPRHIQKYVNEKLIGLSPNTVKRHMANISKCLDSAVKQNIIAFNPAKRIEEIRKVKYTGAKFLREKQIEKLLACVKDDPLEMVILLALFYGLRRSEVLGLKWGAIDFENKTIRINHTVVKVSKEIHRQDSTKNDCSNDTLPLPDMIKNRLIRWKAQQGECKRLQPFDYMDTDYVCTMIDGEPIKPDYVSQHFRILLKKNNLELIRFHDLRHSSASFLKSLGFDLKDIQTWLRHADIQTSMDLYTHLDMSAKWKIADGINERLANMSI